MRSLFLFSLVLCVVLPLAVVGQEPIPPPIWPVSFKSVFGLDMTPLLQKPIVNSTSMIYYNMADDVTAQLIDYPDFCPASPKIFGGIEDGGCQLLFNEAGGIYIQQPSIGVECCMLFAGVGPTPRNFTNGFTWSGAEFANDYWGITRMSDYWIGGDWPAHFYYWTEVDTHHDVYFHDGAGANWAWAHLNVTTIDPSVFDLFSDNDTCSQMCGLKHYGMATEEIQKSASLHGPIALALHHHNIKQRANAPKNSVVAQLEKVTEGVLDLIKDFISEQEGEKETAPVAGKNSNAGIASA